MVDHSGERGVGGRVVKAFIHKAKGLWFEYR